MAVSGFSGAFAFMGLAFVADSRAGDRFVFWGFAGQEGGEDGPCSRLGEALKPCMPSIGLS